MTIKKIEKELKEFYSPDEKIVDIDIVEKDELVIVISVSINHIAWKRWFYIENGELHFLRCECM